jgi:hypothetical protein
MPSSTVKQAKVMSAIAHGWHPSKGSVAKIPVKVAKDFHAADAGHKYGKKKHHNQGGAIKSALNTSRQYAKRASGGKVKKYAGAGAVDDEDKTPDPVVNGRLYVTPYNPGQPAVDPNAGLAADLNKKTPLEGAAPVTPSLTEAHQSPRDIMTGWLAGPDTKSYEPRAVLANKAMGLLDFTPPMMAEQAGEDLAKGNVQEAAMFAVPGVKKTKEVSDAILKYAAKYGLTGLEDPSIQAAEKFTAKHLKEQYGKDLAAKAIDLGFTEAQINNVKTYMSPGAQANFDKHYGKMDPKVAPPELKVVPPSPPVAPTPPDFGTNFGPSINMQNMTKVGDQLGSNPGGLYQGVSGNQYYIKQGKTPDHVRNEQMAASLYNAAGVPTLQYHPVQGGEHVATRWSDKEKDNAYKFTPEEKARAQEDFVVHAWLANHDVVGTGGDNLGWIAGQPVALDLGGALEYRAQGAPKGKSFGNTVGEIDSMRGLTSGIDAPDAAAMFGKMNPDDLVYSAQKVVSIPDEKIKSIVAAHGGDPKLAAKLIARKDDIADRFGLQTHDPNYIEKHLKSQGHDYDSLINDLETNHFTQEPLDYDPFQPLSDEELEQHFAKNAPITDESFQNHDHYSDYIKGNFDKWKDVPPAKPYKESMFSGHGYQPVSYFRKLIQDGIASGGNGTIVKPIEDFTKWQQPTNGKLYKPNFSQVTPEHAEKLGFNTSMEFVKGTPKPDYPHSLEDPANKDSAYSHEKAIFLFPHDNLHPADVYGPKSKPYVLRAEPNRAVEVYWPRLMGQSDFPENGVGYNSAVLEKLINAGHDEGIQLMFIHGMEDMGKANQTQVLVLDTKGTMRGTSAKFDPEHLESYSLKARYPLAGLAGAAAIGANRDNNNGMNRGGKVEAEKALPANHQLGMKVPKGGSMCANCKYLASPTTCGNKGWIEWHGNEKLPHPADEYCCDNYGINEPEKKAEGGGVSKKNEDPREEDFIHFKDGGMLTSDIPGRTDKIPTKVRPGSYVLPADVPSALGQGNSQAGAVILKHMFSHGAYGLEPMKNKGHEFHYPKSIFHHRKDGGGTGDHVPIIAAGGEYIIPPEIVKEIGHGDMSKGHRVLDLFTLHTRNEHIKTLKSLKPPKK